VKANQNTLDRRIRTQFKGKRKIHFVARDHEISHVRNISWTLRAKQAPDHITEAWIDTSWIVEVTASGTRDTQPFHATHLFLTILRITLEALLNKCGTAGALRAGTGSVTPSTGAAMCVKLNGIVIPWSPSAIAWQGSVRSSTGESTGHRDGKLF